MSVLGVLGKIKNRIYIDLAATLEVAKDHSHILKWARTAETKKNFGDALNPFIFSRLTGKKVAHADDVINISGKPVISFIGSILDKVKGNNNIVCGSGFMFENSVPGFMPKKILAVRGPKTRKVFLDNGISCPEVYCDPGLLISKFIRAEDFKKEKTDRYDVGIIPHYVDKSICSTLEIDSGTLSYKVIDIERSIDEVVEEILSCDYILSSSLHGIITAHAYGIPATWWIASDNLKGGSFKFFDYYLSTGISDPMPYRTNQKIDLEEVRASSSKPKIDHLVDDFTAHFQNYF